MKIIPIAEPVFGKEELANVTEAVQSGWISSQGRFIPEFEQGFARYCGVEHGVATSNGTVALHLALEALGIGKGDEVIIPTLTFIATANSVKYTGATPVFVDSHPEYWCIDPAKIEQAVTPRTKAIMPVHLYGHPCDMDAIMDIAHRHNLYVIEDAAEAHGAEYKGRKIGSIGDISCFSFFGNKIITTGEGGMCLTNNSDLASKMRILRDHGMNPTRKYWHDVVGFNYRMTNMQAAIGVAQVKKMDEFVDAKCRIAGWYKEGLTDLASRGTIKLHPEMSWAKCVYWMYSVTIPGIARNDRDKLIETLGRRGIQTRPMFNPIHVMPPYFRSEEFMIAEELSKIGLNLPSAHRLTFTEISQVVEYIVDHLSKK